MKIISKGKNTKSITNQLKLKQMIKLFPERVISHLSFNGTKQWNYFFFCFNILSHDGYRVEIGSSRLI